MSDGEPRKVVCPSCGVDKWIPGAEVWGEYPKSVWVSGKNPVAWKDPISVSSPIAPRVCGECGFVGLFVENPALLWETSRKIAR